MRIPGPADVMTAASFVQQGVSSAVEEVTGMVEFLRRAGELIGRTELLLTQAERLSRRATESLEVTDALLADARETARRAAEVVATADAAATTATATTAAADRLVAQALAVTQKAGDVVDQAGLITQRASSVIDLAHDAAEQAVGVVDQAQGATTAAGRVVTSAGDATDRAAAIVDSAQAMLDRTDALVEPWSGVSARMQPWASRVAESVERHEVEALVTLIDRLPSVTQHLDEDVVPLLSELEKIRPDVHEILESMNDLSLAIKGMPGMGLFKRRGEKIEEDEEDNGAPDEPEAPGEER